MYQVLHISGCRLTQTPCHTCKWQKEKIKGKTFLLPSLLPISHTLPTLKADRDQDPKSRCQVGFKLWSWERHSVCRGYWPYGFAKRPHITYASLQNRSRCFSQTVSSADRKWETSLFNVFLKSRHEIVQKNRPAC